VAKRTVIPTIAVLVLLVVVGAGYYRLMKKQQENFCGFCHRHIHANSRVVAEVGGRRAEVCCARCAISEAYQEKKPLKLISVTDYVSGQTLNPQSAFFVDGSRKVLCSHDEPMFDESKHAEHLTFDRCSPGAYAFAHREDAVAFAKENGGMVVQLAEMLQGVDTQ
jgi:hypothetical protein